MTSSFEGLQPRLMVTTCPDLCCLKNMLLIWGLFFLIFLSLNVPLIQWGREGRGVLSGSLEDTFLSSK